MNYLKKIQDFIIKSPLVFLLIYGVFARLYILITYRSVTIFPDSEDYINLAHYLSQLNLENYTGQRTPGFPTLIALAGENLQITVLFQTLLGLLGIYLLYDFCLMKTKKKTVAFLVTLITTSFLHVLLYEFAILTETLSVTLVLLSFWHIEKQQLLTSKASLKNLIILSVIFAALYLTRPMFIYFPLGFFLFYIVKNFHSNFLKTILKACTILIIPLLCFYSWCSLNESNIGYFTSSYYLGINLSQTATSFFDKAPDEDKLIRDIFVKHRKDIENNQPKSRYPMTVWYAYDELIEETQLSPPDLAHELGQISIGLFKEYPNLYAKQVFISWTEFWSGSSSLLWNVDKNKYYITRKAYVGLWNYIQKPLLVLINILFLVFTLKKIGLFIVSKFRLFDSDLFLIAIVLSGSLAQALVAYGTNSRFCFPFFPLIVYFVIYNLVSLKFLNKTHAKSTSS